MLSRWISLLRKGLWQGSNRSRTIRVWTTLGTTGSRGVRRDAGTQAQQWKISGLPYSTTEGQVRKFLTDNGWTSILWLDQLRRGNKPLWQARAVPPLPEQIFALQVTCGDTALYVEIEPWVTKQQRKPKAQPLNNRAVAYRPTTDVADRPTASEVDDLDCVPVTALGEPKGKKAKTGEGTDVAMVAPSASTTPHEIGRLGLTPHPVDGGGACLYRAIAKLFEAGRLTNKPNDHAMVRKGVADYMVKKQSLMTGFWDHLDSQGQQCSKLDVIH